MIQKRKFSNFIKKISNGILKEKKDDLFILCNDWIYYKRLHPVELEKYRFIKTNFLSFIFIYIFLLIKNLLINFIKLVFSLRYYLKIQKIDKNKTNIIFVSYKFNKDYNLKNDAYFSEFFKRLKKKGINFFIIAANHQKDFLNLKKKIKDYYELNKRGNFFQEIKIFFLTSIYCLKYFLIALIKKNNFERKYYLLFSLSFLHGNTIDNIKYFYQIKDVVRRKKPKSIVSIYEGHALERVIFRAAKEVDSNIKTIAYNHTFISSYHNSIFLKLGKFNDPEKIIFSNQISKKIYSRIKKSRKQKLLCISKNKVWKKSKLNNSNYCLVAPEGLDSENIKLYNFISSYLRHYNKIKFIWRFHPIYHKRENSFIIKNFKDFNMFKNKISFSDNSIDADLLKSKFLLYRGSTVSVKALNKDVIPINLKIKHEYENDFFIDCKVASKIQISSIKDFQNKISNHKLINKILDNKKKILNDYAIINNNIKIKDLL